jgi:CheY-like chemotaxis protein
VRCPSIVTWARVNVFPKSLSALRANFQEMAGVKDRMGACENCDKYDTIAFSRDKSINEYRWLCRNCQGASVNSPAKLLTEIDRQQAERFRKEHQDRVSSGKIRLSIPPPGGPVLVVEDDAGIRESVCQILEDEGFPTVSACNGKEALVALRTLEPLPRLILLDLMMPIMNGWEFYELISRDKSVSSIPVVVMSAQETDAYVGTLRLLRKPLALDQLLSTVNEICLH